MTEENYVYYVHSYYAQAAQENILATSPYGIPITGVVRKGTLVGTQFHPEKSGDTGLRLLKAFVEA
jgi:glutamine amidotransferase